MEVRDFAPKMFELHAAGEYEAARELVVTALPELAEDDQPLVTFWRICLDACTGRGTEALQQLESALQRGWWYGPEMLADADLDTIRDEPRFEAIAAKGRTLQAEQSAVPPSPIVTNPTGEMSGTVLALPAAGGRVTHTSRIWAPAVELGYRTIAVSSSQKVTSDRATWTDLDRAVEDVASQAGNVAGNLVLGGRSLGAAVALHMANNGLLPAAGLILVAPTIRWDLVAPDDPIPTVILAGEQDTENLRTAARETAEFMRQAGCPVDHQIVPKMGHFYPDDFEILLIDALGWLQDYLPA